MQGNFCLTLRHRTRFAGCGTECQSRHPQNKHQHTNTMRKYKRPTRAERTAAFYRNLNSLGLSSEDVTALLRAERTLRRWHELECGNGDGYITRDDKTGIPYWHSARTRFIDPMDPRAITRIPDRERGALRRVAEICARAGLGYYQQTDPRGCALYIIRPGDVPEGAKIDECYTRGVAVCIG